MSQKFQRKSRIKYEKSSRQESRQRRLKSVESDSSSRSSKNSQGSKYGSEAEKGIIFAQDIMRQSLAIRSSVATRSSDVFDIDDTLTVSSFDGRFSRSYSNASATSSNSNYNFDPVRRSTFLPMEEDLPEEFDFIDEQSEDAYPDTILEEEEDSYRSSFAAVRVSLKQENIPSIKSDPESTKKIATRQRFAQQIKLAANVIKKPSFLDKAKKTLPALLKNDENAGMNSSKGTFHRWNAWWHDQKGSAVTLGNIIVDEDQEIDDVFEKNDGDEATYKMISVEEMISTPAMVNYCAAWLKQQDKHKFFFLITLEEYRHTWYQTENYVRELDEVAQEMHESNSSIIELFADKLLAQYMDSGAEYFIGKEYATKEIIRQVEDDTKEFNDQALHAFDKIAAKVREDLMCCFASFRKTDLYAEMYKSVRREVYKLENILLNTRFANYFMVFLFQHNYHREAALWMEIEYELKPLYVEYENSTDEKLEESGQNFVDHAKYLNAKYYANDREAQDIENDPYETLEWFRDEQYNIITRLNQVHIDLYPRFITSRAYADFATYRVTADKDGKKSLETNPRRLSYLLQSYGLRMHSWENDESAESKACHTLESFSTNVKASPVQYVVTLSTKTSTMGDTTNTRLVLTNYPVPGNDTLQASMDSYLVPWMNDPNHVYQISTTCPEPILFNTFIIDGTDELYVSVLLVYEPGPIYTEMELTTQGPIKGTKWVPTGVCLFSKYPFVNQLQQRLSHYLQDYMKLNDASKSIHQLSTISSFTMPVLPKLYLNHLTGIDLPSIDISLCILFRTLSMTTILDIFSTILLEGRILFISSSYNTLVQIIEGFRVLLYPLNWPHVFLPVLSKSMLHCTQCPTPFIMGCYSEFISAEILEDIDETLVINVETSSIIKGKVPIAYPLLLSNDLLNAIVSILNPHYKHRDSPFFIPYQKASHFPATRIRKEFYLNLKNLIGSIKHHRYTWRQILKTSSIYVFDEASYLAASPVSLRPFRTMFIATQCFSEYLSNNS